MRPTEPWMEFVPGGRGQWEQVKHEGVQQVRVGWRWIRVEPTGGDHTLATDQAHDVGDANIRLGHWPGLENAKTNALRVLRGRLVESIAEIDRLLAK